MPSSETANTTSSQNVEFLFTLVPPNYLNKILRCIHVLSSLYLPYFYHSLSILHTDRPCVVISSLFRIWEMFGLCLPWVVGW